MKTPIRIVAALCVIMMSVGMCQSANAQFVQYSNISPLPGSGIAINQNGKLDGLGAMQINIPIAYTPGWGSFVAAAYKGSHIGSSSTEFGNGSGILGMGFGSRRTIYLSAMQTSSNFDEKAAISGQLSLFDETAQLPALSIGEQDIFEKEKGARSPYVALTKSFQTKLCPMYATLGYGKGRFLDTVFYGVSMPIDASLNLAGEYDGFQYNLGVGWRPGGQFGKVTILAGHNGHTGYIAGVGFALTFE